jgi:hypothetical protein
VGLRQCNTSCTALSADMLAVLSEVLMKPPTSDVESKRPRLVEKTLLNRGADHSPRRHPHLAVLGRLVHTNRHEEASRCHLFLRDFAEYRH